MNSRSKQNNISTGTAGPERMTWDAKAVDDSIALDGKLMQLL